MAIDPATLPNRGRSSLPDSERPTDPPNRLPMLRAPVRHAALLKPGDAPKPRRRGTEDKNRSLAIGPLIVYPAGQGSQLGRTPPWLLTTSEPDPGLCQPVALDEKDHRHRVAGVGWSTSFGCSNDVNKDPVAARSMSGLIRRAKSKRRFGRAQRRTS